MEFDYEEFINNYLSVRSEDWDDDVSTMQQEHSEPRYRMYRCYCRRRRESNPLFRAALSNDLEELKNLVETGNSINIQNAKGSSLLSFVMRRKRVEIFDYLLDRQEIDVNFLDRLEQTPLVYLAGVCFDEYFALELIKKGADIYQTDNSGFNFLHLAAKADNHDNLRVGELIIEKGVDVNSQSKYGITPLYAACEVGNIDWICMLLYYGADATIGSAGGVLPLAVLSENLPENEKSQLEEILFNNTFDEHSTTVKLPTLVAAMTQNSSLFLKIIDHIRDVDYNVLDLQHFVTSLIHVDAQNLKLFIEKFGYIVEDLIDNYPLFDILLKIAFDCGIQFLKQILCVFLHSAYVFEFVQSSVPSNSTISMLFEVLNNQDQSVTEDEFTEIACLMLTYGLTLTSKDLDTVYNGYGYCNLFKILLHMDIVVLNSEVHSMAKLYYDPSVSIEYFNLNTTLCASLIDYYNHPKLKNFIFQNSDDNALIEKVKEMPQVPLLVELSRDAVRRYIVQRFNIQTSVHFNTILEWLPVGNMNKVIVKMEQKLY